MVVFKGNGISTVDLLVGEPKSTIIPIDYKLIIDEKDGYGWVPQVDGTLSMSLGDGHATLGKKGMYAKRTISPIGAIDLTDSVAGIPSFENGVFVEYHALEKEIRFRTKDSEFVVKEEEHPDTYSDLVDYLLGDVTFGVAGGGTDHVTGEIGKKQEHGIGWKVVAVAAALAMASGVAYVAVDAYISDKTTNTDHGKSGDADDSQQAAGEDDDIPSGNGSNDNELLTAAGLPIYLGKDWFGNTVMKLPQETDKYKLVEVGENEDKDYKKLKPANGEVGMIYGIDEEADVLKIVVDSDYFNVLGNGVRARIDNAGSVEKIAFEQIGDSELYFGEISLGDVHDKLGIFHPSQKTIYPGVVLEVQN